MSFSNDTKDELARIPVESQCCALAEMNGMILGCGGMSFKGFGRYGLVIRSENPQIVRRYFNMANRWLNAHSDIRVAKTRQLGEHKTYTLEPSPEDIPGMLDALGLLSPDEPFGMRGTPAPRILESDCCVKSFLRGAFLAGGSLNNPEKAYHMEIAVTEERLAECIADILRELEIPVKQTQRKTQYVTYVKNADAMADFMALLGVSKARLDFETIRMNKELRNEINRRVNCEFCNVDKAIAASEKHRSIIATIEREMGLDQLPDNLREIAQLRMQYPDASLSDLGGMTTPQITKSGVNARMRKLESIAEELVNK